MKTRPTWLQWMLQNALRLVLLLLLCTLALQLVFVARMCWSSNWCAMRANAAPRVGP